MAPDGCNLLFIFFFLLLCVHVCVVICSVGITELTQAVGRLVVSWHLKAPIESMLDMFRSQGNLFPCHAATSLAPQEGLFPLIPSSPVMDGLLHILSCPSCLWDLIPPGSTPRWDSSTQRFVWLGITGPGHQLLWLQTSSPLGVLTA